MPTAADSTQARLDRASRAHSSSTLSSSLFSPLTALPPPPSTPATRPRSKSYSLPPVQPHLYSSRGFALERDPFLVLAPTLSAHADGCKKRGRVQVHKEDELLTRFGASASSFGGWDDGEGRVLEWGKRYGAPHDEDEDEEDEEDLPRRPVFDESARTRSSLSVFHDQFEFEDGVAESASSSMPASPNAASPWLQTRSSFREEEKESDIDQLAHSFLATQDRWGLFAVVESRSSASSHLRVQPASTILYPTSFSSTPLLSRTTSSNSLASFSDGAEYELAACYQAVKSPSALVDAHGNQDGIKTVMDVLAGLGSFI